MLTQLCPSQLSDRNNSYPLFHAPTRTVDCNVVLTVTGITLVNGATISAAQARAAAHQSVGPTGNVFAAKAFQAYGLKPETDYRLLWNVPTQSVRDLLDLGWFVTLFIDYGVLTTEAPSISCDKTFTGYHAVGLSDWWRGKLGNSVHYHDPLADGRHPNTPKGVQTAKFSWIRDAAYAYTKKPGIVQGWAVKPR